MKKNFVFAFGLVFLVFSLYSINALTNGTLYANVGENVVFGVGDSVSFDVTASCISGQTNCSGTNYYTCVNNSWINNGNVNGYCNYVTPSDGGTGGGSGNGGSGGSSGGSVVTTSFNSDFCSENWQCDDWSNCVNGTQTRTCTDIHECGTTQNKPSTEQQCESTTSTSFFNINAAVIGITDFAKTPAGVATFVIVGLFAVGGITFLAIKGKFKNFLPKKKEDNIAEQ
ncbi:MAG: hypothetical protein WC511_05885 [Candidatus Pacearchaeota archaeon]|jgi:hypothetical protein